MIVPPIIQPIPPMDKTVPSVAGEAKLRTRGVSKITVKARLKLIVENSASNPSKPFLSLDITESIPSFGEQRLLLRCISRNGLSMSKEVSHLLARWTKARFAIETKPAEMM